jgi:(1->4)-alpha-D-glucan 1-alpha-D-glucosylmutase
MQNSPETAVPVPSEATAEQLADRLFEEAERSAAEAPLRRPGATYRLQLHKEFRFDQVTEIIAYLDELGITDVYLSPYLEARPGSTHGYDIFDHRKINPEIGDEASHARMVEKLAEHGMGRVLDIVPNHMGVAGENRFWQDVLEAGPQAPSARFFDIDWAPVKEELAGRVLLPILEDQYGKVLEDGKLVLDRDGGAFFIRYHDRRFPLAPHSYALVLERRTDDLLRRFDPDDPRVLEYRSIWASAWHLPARDVTDPAQVEQKLREKEVIKRRIARLCVESPELSAFIDGNIAEFRGTPGDPRSFDALHRLLEEQVYRLAYWRVAAEEINYRRFFDINDLAGLRTEDPFVFDTIHVLIFQWVAQGGVTGLRIDHPDGLADPLGYFRRLQETLFLIACRPWCDAQGHGDAWHRVAERLRARFRAVVEADPRSPLARRFPIVAEKILSRGEELPDSWPIDGTVGYGYLNVLNGLFVDPSAAEILQTTYADFTGDREPFAEVLYESKHHIARFSMASEVNALARQLNRVSERDRRSRDFTLNELRRAVREVIACFPVYRTYLQPGVPVPPRDQGYIEQAVARARRRTPDIDASVYQFLQETLLLHYPAGLSAEERGLREAFVRRFQQTTGPMQAKGLEDTAFYRQYRLLSLNEVGADPARFGNTPSVFHALNADRLANWPGSLSTTATHDTKRGEDARIRINVISELADEWRTRLARWSRWNARKKVEIEGRQVPSAGEEYLLYQALIGSWPFGGPADVPPEGFVERFQQYMNKAVREAKINTSWIDPDTRYADAVRQFVAEILTSPDAGPFLNDFLAFQRRVARIGVVHSLAQSLLKIASPGVPDIYQGCELWDLSFVDPDNRRPVDYALRIRRLAEIRTTLAQGTPRAALAHRLFSDPDDGAIKLYLIWTALAHRRAHLPLYQHGAYRPLEAEGDLKGHVVAFARYHEGQSVLVIVPRLVGSLMGEEARTSPIGPDVWGPTRVLLPEAPIPNRWRNLLTDESVALQTETGPPSLALADVFATLPSAMLVEEPSA